jgi:ferritin-like metal-binding protein YciE
MEVRSMADDKLHQKLADYVEDAHAMEQNDLRMIDSMISTTDDPQMKEMLETHKRETEEHERRLRERLDAIGRGTSARKQAQAVGAALLKGVGDVARGDKAGKNARDGYTAEHMEIAAYQLLERLAEKAGDTETAEVARQNRADEEEMARRIDASRGRALDLGPHLRRGRHPRHLRAAAVAGKEGRVTSSGLPCCSVHPRSAWKDSPANVSHARPRRCSLIGVLPFTLSNRGGT